MRFDYLVMLGVLAFLGCPGSEGGDDDNGSGDDDDGVETAEACLDFIACAEIVAPTALAELQEAYGPESACWYTAQAAAVCIQSCLEGLDAYNILFPNVEECGENPSAPVLSNLVVEVDPELLRTYVDYQDDEGDINEGESQFFVDGDLAATGQIEMLDSTAGTLEFIIMLASIELGPGDTFQLGVMLVDRAGNESNVVEQEVAVPTS